MSMIEGVMLFTSLYMLVVYVNERHTTKACLWKGEVCPYINGINEICRLLSMPYMECQSMEIPD